MDSPIEWILSQDYSYSSKKAQTLDDTTTVKGSEARQQTQEATDTD